MGKAEIRIAPDGAEPPAGRLWGVRGPGPARHRGSEPEICFSGWLGLLRALYELTAEPGVGSHTGGMADPGPGT